METVYFISGLGADERAFRFLDLSFCNPVFVNWLRPSPEDTMGSYVDRIKEQIPGPNPVIVGLSFGGMIAVELGKRFPYKKLILISSAKTEKEIPYYLRFMRYLPLHKLATARLLRAGNQFAYRLMGIHNRHDKILFTEMLKDADDFFLTWAIHQIVNWKNREIPLRLFHIHGTKDIILPYKYITADYTVQGGEHLMVLNKPEEISSLLHRVIEVE